LRKTRVARFPSELLHPEIGFMGPHPLKGYFIRVPLKPFQLLGDTVKTSARLDCVSLPTSDLSKLSDQALTYPLNPEGDYIDGSIYIGGAHHPPDVVEIFFGKGNGNCIKAVIACNINFEFEGLENFRKTAWKLEAMLGWTDEPQTA
jgi:hypothetical protein